MNPPTTDVIIYDGECGLCDRFVSFVIARDREARLRFAPQQGAWARRRLADSGLSERASSTVIVATADGRVLERAEAVFHVLRQLPGPWPAAAWLHWLPRGLNNWGYDQIARRRLRFFGRLDACRLPSPSERRRFISDDDGVAASADPSP